MNAAMQGSTVKLIYTICLQNGALFRPLHSGDTLEFTIGRGTVLPGFEQAVIGMHEGETRRATVPAAEAYGPYKAEKIFRMKRSEVLPEAEPLAVGDVVRIAGGEEGEFFAVVREMDSSGVLLDANHPLCGQDITFEIHLLEVTVPGAAPYRNGAIHAAG
jgi:FKBP-type peptidyl-prolyl cis-trans isomerase 2